VVFRRDHGSWDRRRRRLKRHRYSLDQESRLLVIKSHVLEKLDYCNLLLANAPMIHLKPLTKVLHAAIRFVYNLRKRDHISSYLKQAHILPIRFRVMYKTCVMVFKILNCQAPSYLQDFVTLKPPSHINLRSNRDNLVTELDTHHERSIQYAMGKNWNSLPYDIRSSTSLSVFKKNLKTFYFNTAFP